jgi:hypothetical protein
LELELLLELLLQLNPEWVYAKRRKESSEIKRLLDLPRLRCQDRRGVLGGKGDTSHDVFVGIAGIRDITILGGGFVVVALTAGRLCLV